MTRRLRFFSRTMARLRNVPDLAGLVADGLSIGEGAYVARDVLLDPTHPWLIEIGERTTIAPRAVILTHDASMKRQVEYTRVAKVVIGRARFIGVGAIILPGVTIGDEAVVGAGAVVRHDVPPGTVVVGNPAQEAGSVDAFRDRPLSNLERVPVYPRGWVSAGGDDAENQAQKERM